MLSEKRHLFVWTDFCPDWSGGLAVAVARDETEARQAVREAYEFFSIDDWGTLHIHELTETVAYCVGGGS